MRAKRTGATLLEVLMAIMILGIGLVSVASLFPISVIRATQANYLTHATTHRYNAEQIFLTFPHLLRDPDNGDQDGDGNPFNDQKGLNYLIDPLALSQNSPIQGNTIVGQMYRYDGFSTNGQNPNPANQRLNLPSDAIADWLATSPDTWKTRYEGFGTNLQTPNGGPQSLTVSGLFNQNVFAPNNGTLLVRAVIFNTAGTVSQTRILAPALNGANGTTPVGDTISWATNLPNGYAGNIGKVLIQTQAREFTWVATVRNENSSVPDVTIAVFHNRDLNPNFDIAYSNLANPNDQHLNANNQPAQQVFYQGVSLAYLSWQGAAPYLRKGNWVLDTDNGFWYQIEGVVTGSTAGVNWATITLDSPARADSDSQTAVAVFPKGLVDVFPIGAVK